MCTPTSTPSNHHANTKLILCGVYHQTYSMCYIVYIQILYLKFCITSYLLLVMDLVLELIMLIWKVFHVVAFPENNTEELVRCDLTLIQDTEDIGQWTQRTQRTQRAKDRGYRGQDTERDRDTENKGQRDIETEGTERHRTERHKCAFGQQWR